MKNQEKKPLKIFWAEIVGAIVAIGLFLFQLFVSEEDTNNNVYLHILQITLVTMAAIAAIGIAMKAYKNRKK